MDRVKFKEKKQKILEMYEFIKSSEYLPARIEIEGKYQEIDKKDIDEFIENLKKEEFIVSICGQIKSGKSTLLNAWIFEDLVLPVDDTPETTKLTIIKYGEKPKFIAHFYTKEDWENIKNSEYWDNIKKSMEEISRKLGETLIPEEYLDKSPHEHEDLKKLKDYVGAKGRYTLFVKQVELYYPSEILKDNIIIVDTPGTNDPEPSRSRITLEWIKNSDAVVYLTYAGRPFDREDKEFIEKFLFGVPRDKIIIGLTKIDIAEDYKRVRNYIEEVARESLGEEWAKNLFHNKKPYPLAPLFTLYKKLAQKYKENKIELPDDIINDIEHKLYDYPANNPKVKEIIEKSDDYLKEFEDAVYEHIIKQKGKALLESHKQKIIMVFDYHIKDIELKKSSLEEDQKLLLKDEKELEEEKRKLNEFKKEFEKLADEEIPLILEKLKNDYYNEITYKIAKFIENSRNELYNYVDSNSVDTIRSQLAGRIKNIIDFGESGEGIVEDMEKRIEEFLNNKLKPEITNLKAKISKLIKDKDLGMETILVKIKYFYFYLDKLELYKGIKQVVDNLNEKVEKAVVVNEGMYSTSTDVRATKFHFKEVIRETCNKLIEEIENSEQLKGIFKSFIEEPLTNFIEELKEEIRNYNKKIEEMEKERKNKAEELKNLDNQIKELEGRLNNIKNYKENIEREIEIWKRKIC